MSTKKQQELDKASKLDVVDHLKSDESTAETDMVDHVESVDPARAFDERIAAIRAAVEADGENVEAAYADRAFLLGALSQFLATEDETVEDEPYDGPLIYSWLIPGDRGYALEIRVPGNVDVDTARAMALECPVGEGEDARGLSELERVYVSSIEPAVVRDTVDVSLDHQRALEANEKLRHENEAFATTKRVFADAGIDPHAPAEFVERVHDQANGRILAAQSEVADRGERLATALQGAIKHLREVAVMTGFVPYEPPVPAEPDYSDLTIVVDDASVKGLFPRLQDAVWVERMPGAEMPAAAGSGYLLTATRLREFFRMKFGAGETEMADFDAFLEYLDIEIGKPQ